MLQAVKAGSIQEAVNQSNKARHEAVSKRKEILLGTNQYPNFNELAGDKRPLDGCKKCGCDGEAHEEEGTWPNWKPHVQPANLKLFDWKLKIQANGRKLSC